MRLIVANIKKLKLPTKHFYGVTRVPTVDLMTLLVGHHLSKLDFQSFLFGVFLTVHQAGTHLLDSSPTDHTKLPPYDINYNVFRVSTRAKGKSECIYQSGEALRS